MHVFLGLVRRRLSWLVPGAVAIVGLFAGLDALRSSGGEPPPASAERDRAVTTTSTDTAAVLLTGHQPVRLRPGRVSTDLHSSPVMAFRVPPGWYGYQDETGFVLGMGLVGEEVDLVPGGITVYVLDSALAEAARRLAQVEGIQVKPPVRIGGALGRSYARRLGYERDVTLHSLGLPDVVVPPRPDLILLGAGRKTLLIRRAFTTDADRTWVNNVLTSFEFHRFPSAKKEVERISKEWAALFARRPGRSCRYMASQPLCERITCANAGGFKIRNCTPPSSEFRKSFEDATVEAVAIKGRRAAVRFSNGAVIELGAGQLSWGVDKLGGNAGRGFFE